MAVTVPLPPRCGECATEALEHPAECPLDDKDPDPLWGCSIAPNGRLSTPMASPQQSLLYRDPSSDLTWSTGTKSSMPFVDDSVGAAQHMQLTTEYSAICQAQRADPVPVANVNALQTTNVG